MQKMYDAVILGAGIAGLSLADALQSRGWSICVIEKERVGSGASGTPGAMINPATGRRATKAWRAEDCYQAIHENLQKLQPYTDKSFWHRNGILRPAITEKMARKMRDRYENTHWKEGWCRWLGCDEIQQRHPNISCVEGGLWLPVGITLNSKKYLRTYVQYLRNNNVDLVEYVQPVVLPKADYWLIETPDNNYKTPHLIYATGYNTLESKFWRELPLHPIKGQVAVFKKLEGALGFSHSISSLGYMARLPDQPDTFIQGSTYEHDFDSLASDQQGETYLRNRLKRTLPELEPKLKTEKQWAGVRVSTPDRKPLLGRHNQYSNLHIFSGLGSKGLLYGKFLADRYADYLSENTPIPKEVKVNRFYKSNN